ncbi:ubiquitin-conjugating enzyme E2 G1a isoform X1 [Lampris incognitus]|uniref:ubiquitin-conjugating enzyme E2 G1a isoform X1 n=1 Tax=Lampris incognitus TaxID=2546036 RepID=UPI0024B597A0|nr:ubiquitin-conjugating enzyme E2 G1a isoform X1 [Lampris incognitus]
MTEPQSALLLRRQLAELNKNPVEGFSAGLKDDDDLYKWEVLIIGPPDTLYEGGVFKAHLTFPKDYPLRPPKMKFITDIWHPNVDKNGDVCISILHEPGEDKYGYEKPEERWLPIHTVETIMISVISMLADPNGDSPANVDAAAQLAVSAGGEPDVGMSPGCCTSASSGRSGYLFRGVGGTGGNSVILPRATSPWRNSSLSGEKKRLATPRAVVCSPPRVGRGGGAATRTARKSGVIGRIQLGGEKKEWREDRHGEFKRKVARCVRKSQETAFE